jgi:hypothetical protein
MADPTLPTNPTTPTTPKPETAKTGTVPRSDVDLGNVAADVSNKWNSTPGIILLWTGPPIFAVKVTQYNTTLGERKSTGGGRKSITAQLKIGDKEIDTRTENVKGYLEEKYGKALAPSYYPAFGIVKEGDRYKLPLDRNNRLQALDLMVAAITNEGFAGNTYGDIYWQNIRTQYNALLTQAETTDSTVSGKVGTKNQLKKEIKKVLNALVLTIKANYPDTWKTELRVWGFQKEKY